MTSYFSLITKPIHLTTGWSVEWTDFYRQIFGLKVDFTGIEIPSESEHSGHGWVLIMAQNLTLNLAWAKNRERFATLSDLGDNLDAAVPTNDRTPVAAYAKHLRARIEADAENRDLSADDLKKRNAVSITLLERLILGSWCHWKTGKHLDIECATLCAGSRDAGGGVPFVRWRDDRLLVRCCYPNFKDQKLRSRSLV